MAQLPSLSHPLVIPAFLAGILMVGAVLAWVRSLKLRGRVCPRCASTTVALLPGFPIRLLGKGLVARWCAGCDWKGLALRPPHERPGNRGVARLGRSFRWGAPPPPPRGFFNWSDSGPEGPGDSHVSGQDGDVLEGPELPLPGFVWKDDAAPEEAMGFSWAKDNPEPLPKISFSFAEEESKAEQTGQELPLPPPPPIPFRFAGQESPKEEDPEAEADRPERSVPRLSFRWRG